MALVIGNAALYWTDSILLERNSFKGNITIIQVGSFKRLLKLWRGRTIPSLWRRPIPFNDLFYH